MSECNQSMAIAWHAPLAFGQANPLFLSNPSGEFEGRSVAYWRCDLESFSDIIFRMEASNGMRFDWQGPLKTWGTPQWLWFRRGKDQSPMRWTFESSMPEDIATIKRNPFLPIAVATSCFQKNWIPASVFLVFVAYRFISAEIFVSRRNSNKASRSG